MRSVRFSLCPCVIGLALLWPSAGHAQNPAQLSLQRVGLAFNLPVFATAPPGDRRLFVLEQHTGRILILDPETQTTTPTPFLTVPGLTTGSEQGLLGMAFHPGFATNGYFFVNYTTTGGGAAGHSEIARYRVQGDPAMSSLADPASKTVLLTYDQPESNHNAGWLGFGPDGFLYISVGDGGGGDDQHGPIGNGQNRGVLLGKILRIDVDHGSPYSIPAGNPFQGVAGDREEIWAFGLRNPWRCSFDRATGDLWVGDVGQNTREEVDVIPFGVGGLNFGWRPREGSIQNPAYPKETTITPATGPVYDYGRSLGYTVIGGYVYRGKAIPSLVGTYLFADYGTGRFWSFRYDGTNTTEFAERTAELNAGNPKPIGSLSSFSEDAQGELYLCDLADGEIYRIVAVPSAITIQNPAIDGDQFRLQFNTIPGQSYLVEASASLQSGAWNTVTNLVGSASASTATVRDSLSNTQQFYRVRTGTQ